MMKRTMLLGILLTARLLVTPASAGYVVSATETSKLNADGINFDYTITLLNDITSTSQVGTFWFSWVPGKDFMLNKPISETSPSGWTAKVTHGGSTDGFAIQWVANSAGFDLLAGSSLTFQYTSAETPTEMAGTSPFFNTFQEGTAFVYSGAPFSDPGLQFAVATPAGIPEPSSLLLTFLGFLALIYYRRASSTRRVSKYQPV